MRSCLVWSLASLLLHATRVSSYSDLVAFDGCQTLECVLLGSASLLLRLTCSP